MSVSAATRRPAPFSLRHPVARHPLSAFLAMVFAVNTAVALVPVLTRREILPFDLTLYESLGPIFGVALPAFVVVALAGGARLTLTVEGRSGGFFGIAEPIFARLAAVGDRARQAEGPPGGQDLEKTTVTQK